MQSPLQEDPSLEYNAGISWYNESDPTTALILFEKIYTIETFLCDN